MIPTVSIAELNAILPEITLLITACAIFLIRPRPAILILLALAGVVVAFASTFSLWSDPRRCFGGAFLVSSGTIYMKNLILLATAISLIVLRDDKEIVSHRPETAALILLVAAGGCLLISARHLAVAYLAFEMVSVPSYALVGSLPSNSKSTEAGLKYAIFGGVASACLLYGMSLIYGMTGSLYFIALPQAATGGATVLIAVILIFAGLMYKLAATPFHYWCPDAFEGAPFSVAGFLSVAPKIAGFGLIFALGDVLGASKSFSILLAVAAGLSMTVGNLAALAQTNVKRLLAYSSIAHAGYLLLAASLASADGAFAIRYYLTVYVFMNIGAFYVAGLTAKNNTVDEFRGLGRRNAFLALCMAVFLFSLTGLPPFGGFVGKLFIIAAALKSSAFLLIIVLVVNTVISLFYYARILRAMYLEEGDISIEPADYGLVTRVSLFSLITALVALGLFWGPLARLLALL